MNKDRSRMIGGSDISAIMGMNRWCTPLQLWAKKKGKIKDEGQKPEYLEIGTELEEYVSRKFMQKTGFKLRRDERDFTHPDYPYMQAHIDRWICGEDALFEAKTASMYKEKEWADDEIPIEYIMQVNWYCGIVGKAVGYIAVLIGGQKFVWKKMDFDRKLFDKQVIAARDFFCRFIDGDEIPMAMGDDNPFMAELYPDGSQPPIKFEGHDCVELDMWIEERQGGKQAIVEAKKEVDAIEAKIKQKLGEAEAGETDQYRITWRTVEKKEYTVKPSSYRCLRTKQKRIKEDV